MKPFPVGERLPFAWANSMHATGGFCFLKRSENGMVYRVEAAPCRAIWNCMGWEGFPLCIAPESGMNMGQSIP